MSTTRRRVWRPPPAAPVDPRRQNQTARQRRQLALHRANLDRWMTRLRRAFHAVEKHGRAIRRLERQIAQLEQG